MGELKFGGYRDMADKNEEAAIPLRFLLSGHFCEKFEPLLSTQWGRLYRKEKTTPLGGSSIDS